MDEKTGRWRKLNKNDQNMCTLHRIYYGDQRKDEFIRVYHINGKDDKYIQILLDKAIRTRNDVIKICSRKISCNIASCI